METGVLVVEDEVTLARNIQKYLNRHGYSVIVANDGNAGVEQFLQHRPRVVLVDYNLPDISGLRVVEKIRGLDASARIVFITAHGTVPVAVEAMKTGADDYLSKPLVLGELKFLLDRLTEQAPPSQRDDGIPATDGGSGMLGELVGESAPMRQLKQQILRVIESQDALDRAASPVVLLTGETGVGKELVARALHHEGRRSASPFIEVNCTSIPADLLEAELFGYERGAFTGASDRKLGLVEAANGGTLFLDEIGDMSLGLQSKILHLLQERRLRRLGSVREHEVDIMIIAATNVELEQRIAAGEMRSDLYYRISGIRLRIPPLRERGQDVVLLARHFLDMHARRYRRSGLEFTDGAIEQLVAHSWPGNVRELNNVVEQAVLLSGGHQIRASDLSLSRIPTMNGRRAGDRDVGGSAPVAGQAPETLDDMERSMIESALERAGWNVSKAARSLGISRDTLRYRINRHAIELRRE